MKFLIDNPLSPRLATALAAAAAVHVRSYTMGAASDPEFFARAEPGERTIVSAHTDFGSLLAQRRASRPSVVLLRQSGNRDNPDVAVDQFTDKFSAAVAG